MNRRDKTYNLQLGGSMLSVEIKNVPDFVPDEMVFDMMLNYLHKTTVAS